MRQRLPESDLPALRRALLAWHRRHALEAPWRASGDAYQALVAAVMAQQTQMARVLPKFDEFVAAFPTVESLAGATTARVLRIWAPLGYNVRALRLQRAARQIARRGGFPRTAAELEEIEGIGPFTAAIVASFAFGEPVAAFDTNVERVVRRLLGDVDGRLPKRALRETAEGLVARRAAGRWNQAMMDLGALVCSARSPRCDACPLARWCRARPQMTKRAAEARDRLQPVPQESTPFRGSRRYYRGRIVQALRERASLTPDELGGRLDGGLGRAALAELIDALRRDGLVRVTPAGRLRLP